MNRSLSQHGDSDDWNDLERLIAGAKDYVVPSENLRPQVVEAARELEIPKSELNKLRNFGICVGLTWLMAGAIYLLLSHQRKHFSAPSSGQVQRMSYEYAEREGVSQEWALVEVFQQQRSAGNRSDRDQVVSSAVPESK
jgi:hypothetical protein